MSEIEQVIGEYLQACEKGEAPNRDSLCRQHPEIADELDEFFAHHDQMQDAFSSHVTKHPANLNPRGGTASLVENATSTGSEATGQSNAATVLPTVGVGEMPSSTVDLPSMEFGDYELVEEIARGGMGVIYRARHRKIGRIVALKMIQTGRLASQEEVERFFAEAGAVACLSHPGIVPLYEFGVHNGWHFYTMELIEGTDLDSRVRTERFSSQEAAEIVLSIAEAVAHAHEKGIVHRDLKPSNVLIDGKGNPRVTDFGLAKRLNEKEHLTMTGQILGTASYMAPEQAAGSQSIDERADIYALGSILYCLCTGHPPFQADNQLDLLLRVLEGEPKSPRILRADIPKPLEQICMRCLRRNKDDRYKNASDVAEDLKRFLAGEPILSESPKLLTRIGIWARQKPALAAHIGAFSIIELFRHARYLGPSLESWDKLAYHFQFTVIFVLCVTISFGLQLLSDRTKFGNLARYLWVGLDVVMATTALAIVDGSVGMLVMCLALIIVGAGAFSRVGIVVWATVASLTGFIFLLAVRSELTDPNAYYPIAFCFLGCFGILVGIQVYRLRLLSRRVGL